MGCLADFWLYWRLGCTGRSGIGNGVVLGWVSRCLNCVFRGSLRHPETQKTFTVDYCADFACVGMDIGICLVFNLEVVMRIKAWYRGSKSKVLIVGVAGEVQGMTTVIAVDKDGDFVVDKICRFQTDKYDPDDDPQCSWSEYEAHIAALLENIREDMPLVDHRNGGFK